MAEHESLGRSISLLADEQGVLALLVVADAVKPSSRQAIQELRALGITTVMLTGDNLASAQAIARETGISDVQAELLPQQKLEVVQALNASNGNVSGMVGDGINDAPALATADIGFAVGSGTDIAVESADIVLVRNDLESLVKAVTLSRKTMTNIRQNLFWALIFNCIGIPLAAVGMLSPIVAGTAMAFSSVTVVSNSLRLKRTTL